MIFKIKKTTKVKKIKEVKPYKEPKGIFKALAKIGKFFAKIGGYFKGSWIELKQVRWPNRKATWGLTGAVILFTCAFLVFIVLLDAGYKELFKLIIR